MLTRLAETGLNLAAAVERLAQAEAPPQVDLGLVFSRIARAVRLTIALQSRLMKDLVALDAAQACDRQAREDAAADAEAKAERDRAAWRADRIHRIVRRAITAEHRDQEVVERLSNDLWERLDDDDIYGDFLDRPIGEVVARICADLGISPDWSRFAGEAWALEDAECGGAGSRFADRATEPIGAAARQPGFAPQAAAP